jgi:hypothetical protein
VDLTATVTGALPTGSVQFLDGAAVIGAAALSGGAATLSASFSAGNHSLTASYAGDANNLAATSPPVVLVSAVQSGDADVPTLPQWAAMLLAALLLAVLAGKHKGAARQG